MTTTKDDQIAYPCGVCYCGCGQKVEPSKFFVTNHDRALEARIIKEQYGSIATFALRHGYAPKEANRKR